MLTWSRFNLLGQVAVTTGISFGAAGLMSTLISYNVDSFVSTPGTVLGLYAALLLTHGIVNTAGVGTLTTFNRISIAIHSLGIGALAIALLVKAPKLQPASFVFNTFYDGTGVGDADGWSIRASKEYVGVAGLLFSQYTITGVCLCLVIFAADHSSTMRRLILLRRLTMPLATLRSEFSPPSAPRLSLASSLSSPSSFPSRTSMP